MCKECKLCPFAFTDASEEAQNFGCLPSPYDIIQMKRETGHNWGCHSVEGRVCAGFVNFISEERTPRYTDIDTSKGGIISYDTWDREGLEAAIAKAEAMIK